VRIDLGTLGQDPSHAIAINDHGAVLLRSVTTAGEDHPALWRRGVLTDLAQAGVRTNGEVVDYNNRGEIAGSVRPEWGIARAVIYQPEPASTAAVGS
jgi:uncharacterized membrane protein